MNAPVTSIDAIQRQLSDARTQGEGLQARLATALGLAVSEIDTVIARRLGIATDTDPEWRDYALDQSISEDECRRWRVAVLAHPKGPHVLADDPWDLALVRALSLRLRQLPVLVWSTPERIAQRLDQGHVRAVEVASSINDDGGDHETALRRISRDSVAQERQPVVRYVDHVLVDACVQGASDIHLEMTREGLAARLRLDGVLIDVKGLASRAQAEQAINRIKVLAQLDIGETRIPQDGRFRAGVQGRSLDFRVSIMPSGFGEDAVVRLLDKAQLRTQADRIDLARLGFVAEDLRRIRVLASEPHGMLLVTGPTGSGKTTTLYGVLSELASRSEKIVTIEDPVEYELPGVLQIPVNEKKGLTFARGLRSILRHDPDRILVGEIRDTETADIAVQAALTGHLVYTTVHANSVYDVVGRFIHMGIDLYGFASALNGVVAQRLLRKLCVACSADGDQPGIIDALRKEGVEVSDARPRVAVGCEACRQTGYSGRTVVAETVPVDATLRDMVVSRASTTQMRQHVNSLGVTPLRTAAMRAVRSGVTSWEEVCRVVGTTA